MIEISVIVPVYNSESYLHRCVDSILGQTFTDIELILIDDGSNDSSPEICDAYSKKDSRVVVIHQKNAGQSEARNSALKVAKGAFISFVDSDDWIEKNALLQMYAYMMSTDADIIQGGVEKNWDEFTEVYRKVDDLIYLNKHDAMKDICLYISSREKSFLMNGVWCKLYPRHFFDNCKFVPGRIWEDTQIQGRLIDQADKIVVIPGIHYHYYQGRKDNISKISSIKSDVDSWLSHKERYDEFGQDEVYCDIEKEFVLCCFDSIVKCWSRAYISKGRLLDFTKDFRDMSKFVRSHRKYIRYLSGGGEEKCYSFLNFHHLFHCL